MQRGRPGNAGAVSDDLSAMRGCEVTQEVLLVGFTSFSLTPVVNVQDGGGGGCRSRQRRSTRVVVFVRFSFPPLLILPFHHEQ